MLFAENLVCPELLDPALRLLILNTQRDPPKRQAAGCFTGFPPNMEVFQKIEWANALVPPTPF